MTTTKCMVLWMADATVPVEPEPQSDAESSLTIEQVERESRRALKLRRERRGR